MTVPDYQYQPMCRKANLTYPYDGYCRASVSDGKPRVVAEQLAELVELIVNKLVSWSAANGFAPGLLPHAEAAGVRVIAWNLDDLYHSERDQ